MWWCKNWVIVHKHTFIIGIHFIPVEPVWLCFLLDPSQVYLCQGKSPREVNPPGLEAAFSSGSHRLSIIHHSGSDSACPCLHISHMIDDQLGKCVFRVYFYNIEHIFTQVACWLSFMFVHIYTKMKPTTYTRYLIFTLKEKQKCSLQQMCNQQKCFLSALSCFHFIQTMLSKKPLSSHQSPKFWLFL